MDNGLLLGIMNTCMSYYSEFENNMKSWQMDLQQQWEDTKKMPRKKKKQRRKEILLDWSIATWEPDFSF